MRTFPALLLLASVGCGVDTATANGELGRMTFTMISDYYVGDHDITENAIVTNHEQAFSVELTGEGKADAQKQADEIEYVMVPDEGVTLNQSGPDHDSGEDDGDAEHAPSFSVSVSDPGEYQLEARLRGETFDRIHLLFDTPDSLELSLYVRDPWVEAFEKVDNAGTIAVEVGSQLAWLPIPLGTTGERLLGEIEGGMSAAPQVSVVPAANVDHVNEDEVQSFFDASSLYFVEEGEVSVTITDRTNPASGVATFEVGEMSI